MTVVHHVPVLSTPMMVWGGIMAALGMLIVCTSPVGALQEGDPFVLLFGLVLSLLYLVSGTANLVLGWFVRSHRMRIPALAAMASSLFTCPFCGFLALALPIYGFVVLLDPEVAWVFRTGGADLEEVEVP